MATEMKGALFDREGTLAHYFEKKEATQVLVEGVGLAYVYLKKKRLVEALDEQLWKRVDQQDFEPEDHRVRPLAERLVRIFRLRKEDLDYDHIIEMIREFCFALFARGRLFEDVADTLKALREEGLKVAIVCNTPWDSPPICGGGNWFAWAWMHWWMMRSSAAMLGGASPPSAYSSIPCSGWPWNRRTACS